MKDQLQLQEIAGYLPYELRVSHASHEIYSSSNIWVLEGLVRDNVYLKEITYPTDIFSIKPILRPMSDFLISDNLYDCNRIMHNEEYDKAISHVEYIIESGNYFDARLLPSCFVDLMKKEHIDFQDLIGRGLAISIHDIPTK